MRPHRRQPTRLLRPWDSPGKNTGVGCHFLLQCMNMKSESEVVQSCLTLLDPMDCSLPGSSIHGIFQARALEWGAIAFSKEWRTYAFKLKWLSKPQESKKKRNKRDMWKYITIMISWIKKELTERKYRLYTEQRDSERHQIYQQYCKLDDNGAISSNILWQIFDLEYYTQPY